MPARIGLRSSRTKPTATEDLMRSGIPPSGVRQALRGELPSGRAGRVIAWLTRPWLRESERATYFALAELARRHSAAGASSPSPEEPLTRYEYRVFSQNGEDGVLAELLGRLGTSGRWFVEFGIENGTEGNCVFLADVMGWSGLFLEPAEAAYEELLRKYSANPLVRTQRAMVRPDNVEELFEQGGVPSEPDVLSIDVDGNDYWIWEAIVSYSPRIVVIEYNAHWPPQKRWVQPYDPESVWQRTDHQGASLGALRSLGEQKGYRLIHTELTGNNAFFVRADIPAVLPAPEVVPLRAPNYYLLGVSHLPHPGPAPPIVDLDAAEQ
jgi:hypothetical protein